MGSLFDHLVGAREQCRGNVEAKQTSSLQIDNEFEPCRLQNRKIGRLGTFEDAACIDTNLAEYVGKLVP